MITTIDQLGLSQEFQKMPERIVSLVPSITELLFELGLGDKVVGRTAYCIYPEPEAEQVPTIGGTKKVHVKKVRSLAPDLIIANKEENTKADIDQLREYCPVWCSQVTCLDSSFDMMDAIASIFSVENLCRSIKEKTLKVIGQNKRRQTKTAVFLIWKGPYMTVGGDTYIHDMMARLGYDNQYKGDMRYPRLELEDLLADPPQIILLTSEPYAFSKKEQLEINSLLPNTEVIRVDGTFFSWYGSRLVYVTTPLLP